MAIFAKVPGLRVEIFIDGNAVAEYNDDDRTEQEDVPEQDEAAKHQASVTVSKYIESISDTEYAVHVIIDEAFNFDFPTLVAHVTIDGVLVNRPIYRNGSYQNLKKAIITSGIEKSKANGQSTLEKFRFAVIDIDENNTQNVKNDIEHVKTLGEIKVRLWRASKATPTNSTWQVESSAEAVKVHEKALKGDAKSHSTLYGPPSKIKPKRSYACPKIDGKNYPFAIFKLKYRSREALKQLMVLPRTPSPGPAPDIGRINLDSLNAEQKKKLQSFLQDLTGDTEGASSSIKRERDGDGNGEGSQKRRKSGERVTIDLLSDEEDN